MIFETRSEKVSFWGKLTAMAAEAVAALSTDILGKELRQFQPLVPAPKPRESVIWNPIKS